MRDERVLVFGHATVDIISLVVDGGPSVDDPERAGGKAFNQAAAAARLGCPTGLVTAIGVDHKAKTIERALDKAGVSKHWIVSQHRRWVDQESVRVTVVEDPFGERLVEVFEDPKLLDSYITAIQRVRKAQASPEVVLCTLELPSDALHEIIEYLHALKEEGDCLVVVNAAPVKALITPSRDANDLLREADIVTANELETLTLLGEDPDSQIDRQTLAAELFAHLGKPEVYVTVGAKGASWSSHVASGQIDAPRVTAADTVGASDVLTAAVALSRAAGATSTQAIAFGTLAAGVYIEHKGGAKMSPTISDLYNRLEILSRAPRTAAVAAIDQVRNWLQ